MKTNWWKIECGKTRREIYNDLANRAARTIGIEFKGDTLDLRQQKLLALLDALTDPASMTLLTQEVRSDVFGHLLGEALTLGLNYDDLEREIYRRRYLLRPRSPDMERDALCPRLDSAGIPVPPRNFGGHEQ